VTGFLLSLGGLVYLMAPGVTAPPMLGTIMMVLSGISWSAYSLLGTGESRPILATARNFLFCWPFLIILIGIILIGSLNGHPVALTRNAILLSVLSGGVASGIGYILWYISLGRISTTQASVAQLAVPVLAAAGGILFLGEQLTTRLLIASVLILSGVTLTISGAK
jgi:drug/metabolite transporter (DMT)-like permease